MLGLLIDVKNNNVSVKMANSLKDYYRLIDCDVIDIVKRQDGVIYSTWRDYTGQTDVHLLQLAGM